MRTIVDTAQPGARPPVVVALLAATFSEPEDFRREGFPQAQQLVGAPLAIDHLANQPGLKIRDDDLILVRGPHEAAVQRGHRQQLALGVGFDEVRRDPLAPIRTRFPLLVH